MNPVEQHLVQIIRETGPIPFSQFMAIALYSPGMGYYERQREIGKSGDFYTSVSVGEVFGQMLAFDFARRLDLIPGPVQIVEAGAHRGQLASDILNWTRQSRPELFERLEYWILEPSAIHQDWQRRALAPFEGRVRWFPSLNALVPGTLNGVIVSNELLDAMPVHRLRWNRAAVCWEEWRVTTGAKDTFEWVVGTITPEASPLAPSIPEALAAVFPDGFTLEVSPEAVGWWRTAAKALKQGILLTLDYGLDAEQFLEPSRANGTLRTYSRHHAGHDVLASPGECDLTAHVDFSAIQCAGESEGLSTEQSLSQSTFFTRIFKDTLLNQSGFLAWTPARLRQFQTLIHPEHLGRAFRVLEQRR